MTSTVDEESCQHHLLTVQYSRHRAFSVESPGSREEGKMPTNIFPYIGHYRATQMYAAIFSRSS